MSEALNRQVVLRARPTDIPQAEHFELIEQPLLPLAAGQFRVHNQFLSVDPAMRGWVSATGNYASPVALGSVMRSFAVGTVVESRTPDVAEGEKVMGLFGWQDYAVGRPEDILRRVGETDLPLSTALGVLGLNGITGYLGLRLLGQPQAGETVVVSTAAGGVGSCVGQIAKLLGCRTVGIAGGATKCRLCVEDFGYDVAIDYKSTDDLPAALAEACPDGVDVYFDNTAGAISDAVLAQLALHARVVVCGTASVSRWDPPPLGPRVERHILVKRARMEGFLFFDHLDKIDDAAGQLAQWVRDGHLRYREEILDGLERAPGSIAGLYRGENLGKRLIKVA